MVALYEMDLSTKAISFIVQCSVYTVRKWYLRAQKNVDLNDQPRSGRPPIYGEQAQLRMIAFYCQTKPLGTTGQWSLRFAARYLEDHPLVVEATPDKSTETSPGKSSKASPEKPTETSPRKFTEASTCKSTKATPDKSTEVTPDKSTETSLDKSTEATLGKSTKASPSKSTLQRVLKNNRLKPHLSRYFLHITDPDFFPKLELLLALFASPPDHLFFFDECPGIQVLKRLTPDLQTDATKKRLKEFEYIRNGTMDVFAFLRRDNGNVAIECHGDHTTETFLGVFERHVNQFPQTEPLHYVMDNLASHRGYPFCQLVARLSGISCPPQIELKTQAKRAAWLQQDDKRIVIHFTPFHGSWLNQVEIWFGIMGQRVLKGSFSDPADLKKALLEFVAHWNLLLAHPFRWSYDGEGLHEKAIKRFSSMLRNPDEMPNFRTLTKLMMLTTNLLNDYYSQIPVATWRQFRAVFLSKAESLATLIEKEKGPWRKKKAEKALHNLNATLKKITPLLNQNPAT